MQQQARSRSIQRACVSMSLMSSVCIHLEAHGAMIARAFGVGIETSPSSEDAVPIGVVESGTASNQPSSCCESCLPLAVYHDPVCEGLRVTMFVVRRRREENLSLKGGMVMIVGECVGWYRERGVAPKLWWGKSYRVVRPT
jgi:hypothetical protein